MVSLGPTAVGCVGAATVKFTNGVNDAACIASLLDKAVHPHEDCQSCAKAMGLGNATAPIKKTAKTAATGAKNAGVSVKKAAKTAGSMAKKAAAPVNGAAKTWVKGAQRIGQAVVNKMKPRPKK